MNEDFEIEVIDAWNSNLPSVVGNQ